MESPIRKPYELPLSDSKLNLGYTEEARKRVDSALIELSKIGFNLPKGRELDYFIWGGGGNNTNFRIHDPETGQAKFMLKLYHYPGRCERESSATEILQTKFVDGANSGILIPREVISKPQKLYRVVDYVDNKPIVMQSDVNSPEYLKLLTDYLVGCAQITDTESNRLVVNFNADGFSLSPYGIYLRYLNRIQGVFNSVNTMQMDRNGKVWGEHTVRELMLEYNIENRLVDKEMQVVNNIGQQVLHTESTEKSFNPRDPSAHNILVQKHNDKVGKIIPIDFEESGWDSPMMIISYWLYHPDTIKLFSVASQRLILENYVEANRFSFSQIKELNARVKLTNLLRASTYLRGVLPEKRNTRRNQMDKMLYPLNRYLREIVFEPLIKLLDEPINKFDL